MKPLPFLLMACLHTSPLLSSFAPFLRPPKSAALKPHHPFFNPRYAPGTSCVTTDTCRTPSATLADENKIFEKVELEASINPAVWQCHLVNRLQSFLDTVTTNIPAGCYKVAIRFVVEKDGRISLPAALNNPGYGLARASEDAVEGGPRWTPGQTFEGTVRSYHTQPLYFMIENDGKRDTDTPKEAVKAPFQHTVSPGKCETDTAAGRMLFL